ncbi:MAG TPA: MarR family transcriptional regulator, partial [Hyphomonas sp.]|nr:MarR family transcriptional regulator [Hyphomonas sp.]
MALGVIKKNPGLTQSELASELELGAAAVGRLIDRLEERDFIVRSPALDDRRAYTLD